MDIAYEIAKYIEDSFSYTLGTDLFVGTLPTGTDTGIFVIRNTGELAMYSPITKTVVDVYYKDTNSSRGMANLTAIKLFMHRMIDTDTENAVIYSMLAISDIEDMGRDQQMAQLYKFSIDIMHRDKSVIS
ncbi:MAG: hypothetical protein DRR04_10390 [Gammaproteobacteria bacterium]|nr:MAG: hypothetical protein DRR04_10390 [Gammaproteobacteria bacterium]